MPSATSLAVHTSQVPSEPPSAPKKSDSAYQAKPGRRKASVRRFALSQRGGSARRIMDVKVRGAVRHQGAEAAGIASRQPRASRPGAECGIVAAANKEVANFPVKVALAYRMGTLDVLAPGLQPASDRPVSAPAGLFPVDAAVPPPVLPERAVREDAGSDIPSRSPATAGAATPIRRAAARVMDAVGTVRDAVYEGVTATGHRCRHLYGAVHDACVGRPRKSASSASSASSAPSVTPAPAQPTAADLVQSVAKLIRKDDLLEIMVRFSGSDITYEKLLYLVEKRESRVTADEAGRGFNAPLGKTDDSLSRRLVSTLQNNDNPWRILGPLGDLGAKYPELTVARERYMAYRDRHYPDFADIHARMKGLSDLAPVNAIKKHIEETRASFEAQGIPFNVDRYIMDNPLDPQSPYPLTARQLSEDLLRLQQCTPDMAHFLEHLDLADCLEEHRRRQGKGTPGGVRS